MTTPQEFTASLRDMADWIDANPGLLHHHAAGAGLCFDVASTVEEWDTIRQAFGDGIEEDQGDTYRARVRAFGPHRVWVAVRKDAFAALA
jgi:hypothetical protein